MSESAGHLHNAFTGRYRLDQKLGEGGMATVYRAVDLKHDRPVAVKVLRPDLAAILGPERFLHEIRVVAKLNHPHILGLYDSGEADGLLYYVMPVLHGESLRDRLNRERKLSIDEALMFTEQIASALDYAHGEGVVHRDVKPENILIHQGEAMITDFGIALSESEAGAARLTETGFSVGTPEYMSPEQVAGERHIDGRSDVYALGCVLFEMMAGEPPFTGPTAQSVLARRMAGPAPPISTFREAAAGPIESALHKSLARDPVDRFEAIADFSKALRNPGVVTATPTSNEKPARSRSRWFAPLLTTGFVVVAFVVVVIGFWPGSDGQVLDLDPTKVVVAPFRLTGNSPIVGLEEAVPDLLYTKLNGDGGLRAADPRAAFNLWRQASGGSLGGLELGEALQVARRLGAGHLLDGVIIATGDELTISTSLTFVETGTVQASATETGSEDDLLGILDRLLIKLLGTQPGAEERLEQLLSSSFSAVQTYLSGLRAYRQGNYLGARTDFEDALAIDSAFAVAALGRLRAIYVGGGPIGEADNVAWALRDKLSSRDQQLLAAIHAERPGDPGNSNAAEILTLGEAALRAAPDMPDLLAWFGGRLMFFGPFMEIPNWERRAATVLDRAIYLDSTLSEAMRLRLQLAIGTNDTDAVHKYGNLYLTSATGEYVPFYRWQIAVSTGDAPGLAVLQSQMDSFPRESLQGMHARTALHGWPLQNAERAAEILSERVTTTEEHLWSTMKQMEIAIFAGRSAEAIALFDTLELMDYGSIDELIDQALVGPGYDEAAEQLAARFMQRDSLRINERCALGLWFAHTQRPAQARSQARWFRQTSQQDRRTELCATLIEAWIDVQDVNGTNATSLRRLDSLSREPSKLYPQPFAALVLARWHENRGDIDAALRSVRRRWYWNRPELTYNLPAFYREEGRLAALAGDTASAIEAYDKYLNLRIDPDAAVRVEVDAVRQAMARLTTESR